MECKEERRLNGTSKLNGMLNNQASFRKTGELEFRQGNQVQEMHELHDALHNGTGKQVRYSVKQSKGSRIGDKPEYEEVDDENSKFGPNSIEQHQRPAFYFLTHKSPQQAVDRPVLTTAYNNSNGRLQEEAPVTQKNEFIKARKKVESRKKMLEKKELRVDPSKMPGYYGDLDVDDICSRIEGVNNKAATLPKSKKPTKKKNEKRKSKDEKVVVDEEEQEEMDVDILLDNDVPPTCSISAEGDLRVRNPFASGEHEDQKETKWSCAKDLGGRLGDIVMAFTPHQHHLIERRKAVVKGGHCDDLAFLDKMWEEFKKNAPPTIYQPKTQ